MKVTVSLLDKEYSFNCTADSKDDLYRCVDELQTVCDSIQQKNPRASADKILVTAAVNLLAQLSVYRHDMENLSAQIDLLTSKIELLD